jgi:hypothetical protein
MRDGEGAFGRRVFKRIFRYKKEEVAGDRKEVHN